MCGGLEFLHVDEVAVIAVECEQFFVCATFNYAPFVEHADEVGIFDGRQAVCYDQGGASVHKAVESLLNEFFAFGVEGRGCLVENQHRGVFQNCTRYG